jgi:hypothetical protein
VLKPLVTVKFFILKSKRGRPGRRVELEVNLGYIRSPCFKKEKEGVEKNESRTFLSEGQLISR